MPDVRLIDANALCKGINESIKMSLDWESEAHEMNDTTGVKYAIDTRQSLLAMLERVVEEPTIDAQPVKQGNWNVTGEYFDKEEHEEKIDFQCSKCSMIYTLTKNRAMPNYCEHCGSKNVRCEYG